MKLFFYLEILVGLGRLLPLCGYVFHYYFVRHIPAARCKISPCPYMPTPKVAPQVRELHQQLVAGLALQVLHHLAHRQLGPHRHKHMDVVLAYMPFHYLYVIRLTDLPHQFAHPHRHRSGENRLAVFGDPYQMVLDVVLGVTGRPVPLHTNLLPQGVA